MYLLIPPAAAVHQLYNTYLHPTMYLLIPNTGNNIVKGSITFPSHYVSINSNIKARKMLAEYIYIPLCIY